jgi:hypothetical protein
VFFCAPLLGFFLQSELILKRLLGCAIFVALDFCFCSFELDFSIGRLIMGWKVNVRSLFYKI